MKIRAGFVSNSSSSSFIVFAKRIQATTIPKNAPEGGKLCIWGDGLYEGDDFFEITGEMAGLPISRHVKLLEVFAEGDGELGVSVPGNLPPGCKAFAIEADYCSTSSMEEYTRRYLE